MDTNFDTNLSTALHRRDWKLDDLSVALRKAGHPVSYSTLYSYTTGRRIPRAETLLAIATALDTTMDDLMTPTAAAAV